MAHELLAHVVVVLHLDASNLFGVPLLQVADV
eukprot:CAMPEP_0180601660 /NCGR_PEP_ID=MMETSP1037_2-20121125/24564_1 /TAXON_ID=632150 /ORGANISM="Azadinium spinosum, Strain 3D9" /LENGTH=31 /DNA_ID= /DNA_START= /DNA_END= /DNA_ORIENTATION=